MHDNITTESSMSKPTIQPHGDERKRLIEEAAAKKKAEATASGVVKPTKLPPTKIPMAKSLTRSDDTSTVTTSAKKPSLVSGMDKEVDANVAPPKKVKDPNKLSVSDVARELGVDPKRARQRIRDAVEAGKCPIDKPEGRWELVDRGSNKHGMLVALLKAEDEKSDEKSDDDE